MIYFGNKVRVLNFNIFIKINKIMCCLLVYLWGVVYDGIIFFLKIVFLSEFVVWWRRLLYVCGLEDEVVVVVDFLFWFYLLRLFNRYVWNRVVFVSVFIKLKLNIMKKYIIILICNIIFK